MPNLQINVLKCDVHPISEGWRIWFRLIAERGSNAPEIPRIGDSRSADHDTVAASLLEHVQGVLTCAYVSISNERHRYGSPHLLYQRPVGLPFESLLGKPRMK